MSSKRDATVLVSYYNFQPANHQDTSPSLHVATALHSDSRVRLSRDFDLLQLRTPSSGGRSWAYILNRWQQKTGIQPQKERPHAGSICDRLEPRDFFMTRGLKQTADSVVGDNQR